MKQDIKHKELRGRQDYVPAKVDVINFKAQRLICTSPGSVDGNFWSNSEEEEI